MSNVKILLGKRIKELRKKSSLTQEQFAEMICIDQRTLSAIECGTNFPTKHFVKITDAFNIELSELFNFEHLKLTDDDMKFMSKQYIDKLTTHDLNIIYKLLKSMSL